MCYGRSLETVRLRNQPTGSGFKICSLYDRGYIYHSVPHSNRNPWKYCSLLKWTFTHDLSFIAALVESLPPKASGHRTNEIAMYCVYMENPFATPQLFFHRYKCIAAVATVCSNERRFSKCLAVCKPKLTLNWNTLGAGLFEKGTVLALTWIGYGAVKILTGRRQVFEAYSIERVQKRSHMASTNGPILNQ